MYPLFNCNFFRFRKTLLSVVLLSVVTVLITICHFLTFSHEKVFFTHSSNFQNSQTRQLISLWYCSASWRSHYVPFFFKSFKCTEKSRIRWGDRPILSYSFQSRPKAAIVIIYQIRTCDSDAPTQLIKWIISMRISEIRILIFIMKVSIRQTSNTHLDLPW